MAHLFHFKPIFDSPLKKVVRGAAVPGGGSASKTWWFSSACKNFGAQHPLEAEIRSSENCALGGYDFTSKSPRSLDRTSPYLFRLTQEESPYTEWLSDFEYLHPFRRYSPPNFEVVRNRAKFCIFFRPWNFFGVCPPKCWTGIIKFGLVLQNFTPVGLRISEISRVAKKRRRTTAYTVPVAVLTSLTFKVIQSQWLSLPYLILPPGWAGSYTCTALSPYQFGPMRIHECNHKVTGNGYKAVDDCEAINRRL